jgi:NTE family protein
VDGSVVAHTPLFEGLDTVALADIAGRMHPRAFAAREVICREGEEGTGLFVIKSGLARVLGPQRADVPDAPPGGATMALLRHGDVVGEMSLVTGEPRSATVVASVPTVALELDRAVFAAIIADYPLIIMNLNRILSRRLARTTTRHAERAGRGAALALVIDHTGVSLAGRVVRALAATSPREVALIDLTGTVTTATTRLAASSVEEALAALDDIVPDFGTVVVVADVEHDDLPHLVAHMDRTIALLPASRLARLEACAAQTLSEPEVVVLRDAAEILPVNTALSVIRTCSVDTTPGDIAWIGRHLARTKLGLALGAGGAKGYAHVAALRVLEEAGYTVDCVAGGSIGAMVGAWMGMGYDAATIERVMRESFTEEAQRAMFKLSFSGLSSGLEVHTRICRETTKERTFADLSLPLAIMAVDLDARQPVTLTAGPVWQALLAATALPGMFPPHEIDGRRLVDSLCLVPVPTEAARDAGADIVLAVNLLSRATLSAWPGEARPTPPPARSGVRMLDTLLEVMDLSQLDASVRHAAQADVVVTPRFGPASWRDFDRADQFLAAGRAATLEQLATLGTLARPQGHAMAIRQ